jgi:hypothetical protein
MAVMIGVGLGLLIGGLVVMWLSPSAKKEPLITIIWWVGLICACFGLVILVTPILNWLYHQVQQMIAQ